MRKLALTLLAVAALQGWAQDSASRPDKDGVYGLGGDVKAPKLLHTAPAQFPADPQLNKMKYRCIIDLVIDADGKPSNMRVEEAQTGPFGEAAIEAVKLSEFKAGTLHGNAVPVRIEVWVPFVQGEKHAVPEVMPVEVDPFTKPNDKNNRPPVVLHVTELQYSYEARRANFEGTALVHAVISERGIPEEIQVVRPVGHGLDVKAIEAVSSYRFAPGLKWGIPIRYPIFIEERFRLH
jgi:TonB family protein